MFVDAWQTGFRYRFFLSFLILKDGLARAYTGLGAWEIWRFYNVSFGVLSVCTVCLWGWVVGFSGLETNGRDGVENGEWSDGNGEVFFCLLYACFLLFLLLRTVSTLRFLLARSKWKNLRVFSVICWNVAMWCGSVHRVWLLMVTLWNAWDCW